MRVSVQCVTFFSTSKNCLKFQLKTLVIFARNIAYDIKPLVYLTSQGKIFYRKQSSKTLAGDICPQCLQIQNQPQNQERSLNQEPQL